MADKYNGVDTQPKLWRDMTPEEKGAILLAKYEGRQIQYLAYLGGDWQDCQPHLFSPICAYRVKPEPKAPVVTESVHLFYIMNGYANIDAECGPPDTHKITLTITDGEVNEIAKVEKL